MENCNFTMFDDSLEGVQIISPDFKYYYVNHAVAKQAHKKRQELLGFAMKEVFPGIENTPVYMNIQSVMETGEPKDFLNPFQISDGSTGHFQVRMKKVDQGVLIYSLDITKQQNADNLLLSQKEMLEHNFETLIKHSPVGIMVVNYESKIEFANAELENIFKYPKDGLVGCPLNNLIPQALHKAHDKLMDTYLKKPSPMAMSPNRQVIGLCFDNTEVDVQIGLTPLLFNGRRQILATVIDISLTKKLEADLKIQNEELNAFNHRVAHDLVAPLRGIVNLSDFVLEDMGNKDYDDALENINRIRKTADQMMELTKDLLNLTRANSMTQEVEEVILHDEVELIKRNLDHLCRENGVTLKCGIPTGFAIKTQRIRLHQILENLISNAIKYSDPFKDDPHVEIIAQSDSSESTTLIVSDNGLGIPEESQPKLFDLFYRAHPKVSFGNGLGTFLVKKHVDILGGEISFTSTPDGTSFTVTLPNVK